MIDPEKLESILSEQPVEAWEAQLKIDLRSGKPGLRTPKELRADFQNAQSSPVATRWKKKERSMLPPEKLEEALRDLKRQKAIRVARWLFRKGVAQATIVQRTGLPLSVVRRTLDPIRHERRPTMGQGISEGEG